MEPTVRGLSRRRLLGGAAAVAALAPRPAVAAAAGGPDAGAARTRVALIKTEDRRDGLRRALGLLGASGVGGGPVLLKPNFNSADPFPGSTHPDMLGALVEWLGGAGASRVTVADRSGMGVTRDVMAAKGVTAQARRLGFTPVALDDLPAREWVARGLPGSHWRRGVLVPRLLLETEAVVSTCCLKTHRFGGHVTLALKNSVGLVARYGPDGYDYMGELHRSPDQRAMIAEINQLYRPALVVLDGLEAFVRGGPEAGTKVATGVILAGTDRVAVDAVGTALLRLHGTTPEVAAGPVFAQAQLARAAALGLGVGHPDAIDLVTDDATGEALAGRLGAILRRA